jgi:hypothetical protein
MTSDREDVAATRGKEDAMNEYMPPKWVSSMFKHEPIKHYSSTELLRDFDAVLGDGMCFGVEPHSGHRITLPYALLYAIRESLDWQRSGVREEDEVHYVPVGEVGSMPGTAGFTMAAFEAKDAPVGTVIYKRSAPPQAAKP